MMSPTDAYLRLEATQSLMPEHGEAPLLSSNIQVVCNLDHLVSPTFWGRLPCPIPRFPN